MRPASAALALLALLAAGAAPAGELPWETLDSPFALPRLPASDQVLLASSRCPSACRYDRTSAGDTRFLRDEGGEQVLLEERGPGAIVRIWMTMGFGYSETLDPTVRIRIRVDGESEPRVDLPLPDFFAGRFAPFTPPLAFDRLASSGGNVSVVPIPYRTGCRVSLVNAADKRIWFQLTFHRLPEGTAVASFRKDADLGALRSALASSDPWAAWGGDLLGGPRLDLAPGESVTAIRAADAGLLTALAILAAEPQRETLRVELVFDGRTTADVSVAGLFAAGRSGGAPARSVLVGERSGWLTMFLPMPFFRSAEVRVRNAGASPASVRVTARRLWQTPPDDSGLFGAEEVRVEPTQPPEDTLLLGLTGRGKWVGLFLESGGLNGDPEYMEGDERVYVDGSPHPAWYGTGLEDTFNGGFSFDRGPFDAPLWGCTYKLFDRPADTVTAAYRLMPTDGVPFARSLEVRLENGPTGVLPMRVWSVAWFYRDPEAALVPALAFDVADGAAAAAAGYTSEGDPVCEAVDSSFEREPAEPVRETACRRASGRSRFVVSTKGAGHRLRLRRRFDAERAGQAADVRVDGVLAGKFPPASANPFRRFREQEIELALPANGARHVVEITPVPMQGEPFTEIRWEAFVPPLRGLGPWPVSAR